MTHGTGHLLAGDWLSSSYDSLAESLLRGESSVKEQAILFERFSRDGQSFMYFGPWPALLRIVLNATFPQFYGNWARVSCLLAAILTVIPFSLAVSRALLANAGLTDRQRTRMALFCTVGFAFGSPVVYLVISSRIYHEAILWGLCGSVWGLYSLTLMTLEPRRPIAALWIFSAALAVAFTSRVTFGIPMCLAAPFMFLWGIQAQGQSWPAVQKFLRPRLLPLLPALAGIALQLWYNYDRFHSPWVFFDRSIYLPQMRHAGGYFNIQGIPSTAWNYFGFSWEYFPGHTPFVWLASPTIFAPDFFVPDFREQCISLSFASSWLFFPALWAFSKRPARPLLLYGLCLAVQAILILSFHFVTERYIAELLPLFALGLIVALQSLPWRTGARRIFAGAVAFSCVVMVSCSLEWNFVYNLKAEPAYRAWFSQLVWHDSGELRHITKRIPLRDLAPSKSYYSTLSLLGNRGYEKLLRAQSSAPPDAHSHITMRPGTVLTYDVPPGSSLFTAVVDTSIATTHCDRASIRFFVRDESGVTLAETETFRSRRHPELLLAPLHSAKSIDIMVSDGGDGPECDQGVWYAPAFAETDEAPRPHNPAESLWPFK